MTVAYLDLPNYFDKTISRTVKIPQMECNQQEKQKANNDVFHFFSLPLLRSPSFAALDIIPFEFVAACGLTHKKSMTTSTRG